MTTLLPLVLALPLSAETLAEIRRAWHAHMVLVFPGQAIDDAQQIAFARNEESECQSQVMAAAATRVLRMAAVSAVRMDFNLTSLCSVVSVKSLERSRRGTPLWWQRPKKTQ